MSDTNKIVLVDADGNDMGTMEKMEAHRIGRLHRAFSIFIFNPQGALLLQQRADTKYHSGGLWSNSCCSHPIPGESLLQGAHRRLQEELGFDCELTEIFTFTYKANVGNGLIEHEHDHVLVGTHDGAIRPDSDEIQGCKWVSIEELTEDISSNGGCYTDWLKLLVEFRLPDLTREIKPVPPSPGLASAS